MFRWCTFGLLAGWLSLPLLARETLKVLFVGNSLTYTNDLPGMLAQLAKAGGKPALEYDTEMPGGCSLEKHWREGRALAKIQARAWDFVVMQDLSNQALANPQSMAQYGKLLAEAAVKQKAKPAFYMTWAWANQPESQSVITKAYQSLAQEAHATLIPAGVAWQAYRRAHPSQNLVTDDRHPDPGGTYLTACVFYAVLYGASPVGLPGEPAKLKAPQARLFQEAAWAAVNASESSAGGPRTGATRASAGWAGAIPPGPPD